MSSFQQLSDLKAVKKAFAEQAKRRAQEKEKAREREREENFFRHAMKDLGVTPLEKPDVNRVSHNIKKPVRIPMAKDVERAEVLRATMSDDADPLLFLESDDGRFFSPRRRLARSTSQTLPRKIHGRGARRPARPDGGRGTRHGRRLSFGKSDPKSPLRAHRARQGLRFGRRTEHFEGARAPLAQTAPRSDVFRGGAAQRRRRRCRPRPPRAGTAPMSSKKSLGFPGTRGFSSSALRVLRRRLRPFRPCGCG